MPVTSSCRYVIGEDGLARLPAAAAQAWIGLLESHKRLTRALEAELLAAHGLSLSGLELLGRLAASSDRTLGLSALAEQAGLSLSRVSRLVDGLARRGLVQRQVKAGDGRARQAGLTPAGFELLRVARLTHYEGVQRRFFDRLAPGEIESFAAVLAHLAPDAAQDCT